MKKAIIQDKQILIQSIKNYIEIIQREFSDYVHLKKDIDFEKIVHIEETGTISLFVSNGEFYFPLEAYRVLEELKKYSKFGSNKEHKTYTAENLLTNDNDFFDYIEHLILIGATPLEYFLEILLHETMHFCGSNGASALMEGLNEYLTRWLALKYNLKTNGCGYPKEIQIIIELEKLFGIDTLIKLAFSKSKAEIYSCFEDQQTAKFFLELDEIMNKEFQEKYYRYKFGGLNGPFEKAKKYASIDYSSAIKLIDNYKFNHIRENKL